MNKLSTFAVIFALTLGSTAALAHHVPGHHTHHTVKPATRAVVGPNGVVVRAPVGSDVDVDVDGNDVDISVDGATRGLLGLGVLGL